MPHRLEHYRQKRDHAREQAEHGDGDREAWRRLAGEWQTLLDALSAELADGKGTGLNDPKPR